MPTKAQLNAIMIAPMVTSFLSIMGSSYIVYKVLSSKQRRSLPLHRLLAGMSIYDICSSTAYFLSTWPSPVGTPGVKFAMGNNTTCTIQGFFVNFVIGVALYNTCLSIYFLLIIRYKFTTKRMEIIERLMHAIPFIYSIIGGSIIAADTSFNSGGRQCWVSQVPFGCRGDDCVRGRHAFTIQWILFYILVVCILAATLAMFGICWTVFMRNKKLEKRLSSGLDVRANAARKKKRRDIFLQALLYLGALYVTWIFSIANRLYFVLHGRLIFGLHVFATTVHPLQGAFNVLVYMRKELFSKFTNQRKRNSSNQSDSNLTLQTPPITVSDIDKSNGEQSPDNGIEDHYDEYKDDNC